MPQFFKKDLLEKQIEAPEEKELLAAPNEEDPLRTIITWKAPSRPFRKKDRSYYTTVAILVILFAPIALFLGGATLLLALLALGFAVYVFNLVSPDEIEYRISTQGVTIGDHFYHWQELDSFWVSQKDGSKILNLLTRYRFPGVLIMIMSDDHIDEIKRVCAKYLPFHEIAPKSLIEKWSEGLHKHFPLENPHK